MITRTLPAWLDYIASVHPRAIELGLDRIRAVATRLQLQRPAPLVITVAGTNGKGSCVATLEALLQRAGYRSASYTSPHIHLFNERVRIAGENVDDASLCDAFARVEASRADTSLSYFEYATLAALWLFQRAAVDIAILEVGLGGRLDAVNLIDADVVIIASISLDHQDWLGNDLESIAAEKAGIMRAHTPAIYAAAQTPANITERARSLAAPLLQLGVDFGYQESAESNTWQWYGQNQAGDSISWQDLPRPSLALSNVAASIQALQLLPLTLQPELLAPALATLQLAGRCEMRRDLTSGRRVLFDVAHNPAGAAMLAANIERLRANETGFKRLIAVVAVMADKDIEGMVTALESCVDIWYIAQVKEPRCLAADAAVQRIRQLGSTLSVTGYDSVQNAYVSACLQASEHDLVLVTGSFHTVAAVREMSTIA